MNRSEQKREISEKEIIAYLENKYTREFNIVKKFFSGEDKAKLIKEDLLKFVKTMATEENLVEQKFPQFRYRKSKISQSQVRKHYNYFLDVYQDVEFNNKKFEEKHKVKLAMEKVYVNYDFAREKINCFFKKFVEDLIDEIKDFETLESAKVLFEALVGYSKLFLKS